MTGLKISGQTLHSVYCRIEIIGLDDCLRGDTTVGA